MDAAIFLFTFLSIFLRFISFFILLPFFLLVPSASPSSSISCRGYPVVAVRCCLYSADAAGRPRLLFSLAEISHASLLIPGKNFHSTCIHYIIESRSLSLHALVKKEGKGKEGDAKTGDWTVSLCHNLKRISID